MYRGQHIAEQFHAFPAVSAAMLEKPVILPPGRAKLVTSPTAIGSATAAITIGMVVVACFAARAHGVKVATMTSTCELTSSVDPAPMLVATRSEPRHAATWGNWLNARTLRVARRPGHALNLSQYLLPFPPPPAT